MKSYERRKIAKKFKDAFLASDFNALNKLSNEHNVNDIYARFPEVDDTGNRISVVGYAWEMANRSPGNKRYECMAGYLTVMSHIWHDGHLKKTETPSI